MPSNKATSFKVALRTYDFHRRRQRTENFQAKSLFKPMFFPYLSSDLYLFAENQLVQ